MSQPYCCPTGQCQSVLQDSAKTLVVPKVGAIASLPIQSSFWQELIVELLFRAVWLRASQLVEFAKRFW